MSTRKNKPGQESETEAAEEIPVKVHEIPTDAVDSDTEAAADAEAEASHGADADREPDLDNGEANTESQDTEAQDPLEAAKKEAGDYYDRLLRLSAEFENYKKRSSRELTDFRKFANEQIIKDLLGVIDNLERALTSAADQEGCASSIAEGVELTLKEITKILEKHGVTVITAEGETFDPTYHQAVMQQETADRPPNTVVQELQKGYLLHNRLLRPSMVVVSKAAGDSD
jgi:molecular chaperone GrpE